MSLLACLCALLPPVPAQAEPQRVPIGGDGRYYLAVPPPARQPAVSAPAMLLLHGAWDTPEQLLDDPPILESFARAGVLLIAPQGVGGSWAVPNAPGQGRRDDIGFLDAVIADAAARFSTDPTRLRIGGFSAGASMAATHACQSRGLYQAVLTVSGTFWLPIPQNCPGGPLNWMHIHGETDPTWPLAGRTIRNTWRQSDAAGALSMLGRGFACTPPATAPSIDDAACEAMRCGGGTAMRICLHPGGHDLRAAWFDGFFRWAEAVSTPGTAR
jgi:polyhydroxybutyrate depolymerase